MKNKKVIGVIVAALLIVFIYAAISPMSKEDNPENEDGVKAGIDHGTALNQDVADDFVKEVESSKPTVKDPLVVVNPYDFNEMSAYVGFKSDEPVKATYTVVGKTEDANFTYTAENYKETVVLAVIGLYSEYDNTVVISLENESGEITESEITITVGKVKGTNELFTIHSVDDEAEPLIDNTFFASNGNIFYDRNGEIRGNSTQGDGFFKVTDGFLYEVEAVHNDDIDPTDNHELNYTALKKMDIMGRVYAEYVAPEINGRSGELHHDYTIDNEGNVYVLGGEHIPYAYTKILNEEETRIMEQYTEEYVETMIYKYAIDGELLEVWDYLEYFDENRINKGNMNQIDGIHDPIHFNSIEYYAPTNSLILSSQQQSGIISADATSGELQWVFGDRNQYRENAGIQLWYPKGMTLPSGQHTISILDTPHYQSYYDAGKIVFSMYDNRNAVNEFGVSVYTYSSDTDYDLSLRTDKYARQLIYAVDLNNFTVEYVHEFDYRGVSAYVSNVYQIGEHHFGGFTSFAKNYQIHNTADKVVLDLEITDGGFLYRFGLIEKSDMNALMARASDIDTE